MFSCCLGRKVTGSAVSPLTRNCARRVPARVHLEVSPLPAHAFQKRPVRLVANPSYLGILQVCPSHGRYRQEVGRASPHSRIVKAFDPEWTELAESLANP